MLQLAPIGSSPAELQGLQNQLGLLCVSGGWFHTSARLSIQPGTLRLRIIARCKPSAAYKFETLLEAA